MHVKRWPWWARILRAVALAYVGVLILLLALERVFLYHPTTAAQDWRDPPSAQFQDVNLTSATGEAIHAWWLPRPGAEMVVLNSHGNAGNLSHRGPGMMRWSDELNASVMIYDYPGYGKSSGKPYEATCYAAAEAAWTWLTQSQGVDARSVLLLGGSLGGAMAAELAYQHDCRGLVLYKSFSSIPDMAQLRYPFVPARYFVRHRYDNVAKVRDIRRPVFIVHGTADEIIPFVCGERLYAAANEPKEFMRVEGDRHESKPADDFFPRLRAFLSAYPAE